MWGWEDIIKFLLLNTFRKSSSERSKTKIAIVGTGASGKSFFYSAERLSKVKYVFSENRRQHFIYKYCQTEVTDDYNRILDDPEISSIIICNSNNKHFEFAKRALNAGKNCLIEKPICLTVWQCDELKNTADQKKVYIGGILQFRFLKALRLAKNIIDSGKLGEIIFINAKLLWRREEDYFQFGRGTKQQDGGGVLIKQAIHCIDCLSYLGSGITDTLAFAANIKEGIDIEDTAVAIFRYNRGSIGTLSATIRNSKNELFLIEIVGSKGRITFNQNNKIVSNLSAKNFFIWNLLRIIPQNLIYEQIKDFLEAVRGKKSMKVDFSVARECVKAIELIYGKKWAGSE